MSIYAYIIYVSCIFESDTWNGQAYPRFAMPRRGAVAGKAPSKTELFLHANGKKAPRRQPRNVGRGQVNRKGVTVHTSFNQYTNINIYVCTYVRMYVCMCTYVCMYVCIYVFLCIHILYIYVYIQFCLKISAPNFVSTFQYHYFPMNFLYSWGTPNFESLESTERNFVFGLG